MSRNAPGAKPWNVSCALFLCANARRSDMSNYAGRSQEDRIAQRKEQKPRAQEQPGGAMAREGTQPDKERSSGELSEKGKEGLAHRIRHRRRRKDLAPA